MANSSMLAQSLVHAQPEIIAPGVTTTRNQTVDALIEQIEAAIDAPVEAAIEAALSALYRLAEFCTPIAFQPACRLLRVHDADAYGSLFETAVTEVFPWILARTFDGDVETLLDGILDNDGDQFVRAAMLRALVLLVHDGRLGRSVAERAVAALPQTSPDIEQDCLWRVWSQVVAALQLHELVPLVERTLEGFGSEAALEALDTFKTEYAKTVGEPMYLFTAARSDFRSFATADEARARVEDVNESMWHFRDLMTVILRERAETPMPPCGWYAVHSTEKNLASVFRRRRFSMTSAVSAATTLVRAAAAASTRNAASIDVFPSRTVAAH